MEGGGEEEEEEIEEEAVSSFCCCCCCFSIGLFDVDFGLSMMFGSEAEEEEVEDDDNLVSSLSSLSSSTASLPSCFCRLAKKSASSSPSPIASSSSLPGQSS